MQKYLVSKLSHPACQVLLFLMVSQGPILLAEFATIMHEQEMKLALHELESLGLIRSIPQDDGLLLVALVDAECLNSTKAAPQAVLDEKNSLKLPLDLCREADEENDYKLQISAVRSVWDQAFPVDEYPHQRMTDEMAVQFLTGRSAVEVAVTITDAVSHATSRIISPRSYILTAIKRAPRSVGVTDPITEEVKELTRKAQAQYAKLQQHSAHKKTHEEGEDSSRHVE